MQEYQYASLDAEKLAKLKSFEEDFGNLVLAVEPAVKLANLSPEQLAKIQELEQELEVLLLAYKPQK